jgi:hypothetical protein
LNIEPLQQYHFITPWLALNEKNKKYQKLGTRDKRKRMRLDKGQIEVIDDVMAEILRNKSPAERIHIGSEMWTSAQKILFSHLRTANPHWSNEQLRREVAHRLSHGTL